MVDRRIVPGVALLLAACSGVPPENGSVESAESAAPAAATPAAAKPPSLTDEMPSPTGRFQTLSTKGAIDASNPFFASLGSNGRTCASCHQAQDAWTITPVHAQAIFDATTPKGLDP